MGATVCKHDYTDPHAHSRRSQRAARSRPATSEPDSDSVDSSAAAIGMKGRSRSWSNGLDHAKNGLQVLTVATPSDIRPHCSLPSSPRSPLCEVSPSTLLSKRPLFARTSLSPIDVQLLKEPVFKQQERTRDCQAACKEPAKHVRRCTPRHARSDVIVQPRMCGNAGSHRQDVAADSRRSYRIRFRNHLFSSMAITVRYRQLDDMRSSEATIDARAIVSFELRAHALSEIVFRDGNNVSAIDFSQLFPQATASRRPLLLTVSIQEGKEQGSHVLNVSYECDRADSMVATVPSQQPSNR